MKILVTGAAGALAQQVIRRLQGEASLVVVDSRREVTTPAEIPSHRCDFLQRGFEDLFRQHRFDAVIHLGRLSPHEYARERRYNANVLGTQRLFELCLQYGVRQVLVMSTYFVYGAHPYNPAFLTEEAPLKALGLTSDLVDSVELENLTMIQLWKHPELNITLLRPCNIVGPGVNNTISQLLMQARVPVLMGFSPLMQFLHVADAADAIVAAFRQNRPGIYNLAGDEVIAYQDAVRLCGCRRLPVPSVPPALTRAVVERMAWKHFPPYLLNYFRYAVTIDGSLFRRTFGFTPAQSLDDIFSHYANLKG